MQAFEDELEAAAPDDAGGLVLEAMEDPATELAGVELVHGSEDGVADHMGDDPEEGTGQTGAGDDESTELLDCICDVPCALDAGYDGAPEEGPAELPCVPLGEADGADHDGCGEAVGEPDGVDHTGCEGDGGTEGDPDGAGHGDCEEAGGALDEADHAGCEDDGVADHEGCDEAEGDPEGADHDGCEADAIDEAACEGATELPGSPGCGEPPSVGHTS